MIHRPFQMGQSDLVGCSWSDGAAFRGTGQGQRRGQLALRNRPRPCRPAVAQRHGTHPRRAHHSTGGPSWTPLRTEAQKRTSGFACCTTSASSQETHRLEILLIVRHAFKHEASCQDKKKKKKTYLCVFVCKKETEKLCVCCVCVSNPAYRCKN